MMSDFIKKIDQYIFFVPKMDQNLLEYRIFIMQGLLEQKYKEIFEIKIKQERLCQLLQNFNIKIHNLEENQRSIQNGMSMSNILDEVKKFVKALVKQESTQMIYKFYEKIQSCNKDISRLQSSCKNFEKNLRTQFQGLNQKQKLLEKTVSYLNCHEILKLKSDLQEMNSAFQASNQQLLKQLNADRQKIRQANDKIHAINEALQTGVQRLESFQQNLAYFGKKIDQQQNTDKYIKIQELEQRQKLKDMLPVPHIVKKSRISARKTIDNNSFQRSFEHLKQSLELKESKESKELRQSKMRKNGKQNDILIMHKKIENLEKRMSGITDSHPSIIITQNIQNERDSIISTQQLTQLGKFDSAQNMDRKQNKSSMKRSSGNLKRGSIKTENNRQSCVQDNGRSYFAGANNNTHEMRKFNQRLTSLHFKYTLMQENYGNLLNKINKLGNLEVNIQTKIEEAEKLRVDVNTINEIKLRFKQIQTAMQLEEIRYVNHSTYQKEIQNIYKRISAIDVILPIFAKKQEVLSAFAFVQNKIKQIVIVLSNKFEEQKMGAINKIKHIRCLTCDKQTNLNDMIRPKTKADIRNSLNNRHSYDKAQIAKRMKTEYDQ